MFFFRIFSIISSRIDIRTHTQDTSPSAVSCLRSFYCSLLKKGRKITKTRRKSTNFHDIFTPIYDSHRELFFSFCWPLFCVRPTPPLFRSAISMEFLRFMKTMTNFNLGFRPFPIIYVLMFSCWMKELSWTWRHSTTWTGSFQIFDVHSPCPYDNNVGFPFLLTMIPKDCVHGSLKFRKIIQFSVLSISLTRVTERIFCYFRCELSTRVKGWRTQISKTNSNIIQWERFRAMCLHYVTCSMLLISSGKFLKHFSHSPSSALCLFSYISHSPRIDQHDEDDFQDSGCFRCANICESIHVR